MLAHLSQELTMGRSSLERLNSFHWSVERTYIPKLDQIYLIHGKIKEYKFPLEYINVTQQWPPRNKQ